MLVRIFGASALVLSVSILSLSWFHQAPAPLRWEPEGLYHDYNFRDVGKSFNECLGRAVFKEGLLTRSNKFFSGWSCENIGNPQHIYSLNYDPADKREYYCRGAEGNRLGAVFNRERRIDEHELYSVDSWGKEEFRKPLCSMVSDMLSSLGAGESVHMHCSAGRDRTGSVTAIVGAALVAYTQLPFATFVEVAECDYRKSSSLQTDKYDNIKNLLQEIEKQYGGAHMLLIKSCGIEPQQLQLAAANFSSP